MSGDEHVTKRIVPERKTPGWGRAALYTVLGALLLSYLGVSSNILPGLTWMLVLAGGLAVSIVLAIVSLARGERRVPAAATLGLVLVTPVALFIGFWVFFEFFYVG